MKLIVRAFVVVLVLTGAVATTQISSASTQNKVTANRVSLCPYQPALRMIRTPAAWVWADSSGPIVLARCFRRALSNLPSLADL